MHERDEHFERRIIHFLEHLMSALSTAQASLNRLQSDVNLLLAQQGSTPSGTTNDADVLALAKSMDGIDAQVVAALKAPTTLTDPVDVVATPAAGGTINLTWSAPTGATGFNVFRGTVAGQEGSAPVNPNPMLTPAFVDTGLSLNTAYFYTVTAIYPSGTSAPSTEATATTLAA